MTRMILVAMLVGFWATLACGADFPEPPAADELEAATTLVDEVYPTPDKADAQRTLAKRIIKDAGGTKELTVQFAMLQKASSLAQAVSDTETTLKAIDEIAARFAVATFEIKTEALTNLYRGNKDPKFQSDLTRHIHTTVAYALHDDGFPAATQLAVLAVASARLTRDDDIVRQTIQARDEVARLATVFEGVTEAIQTLKTSPGDSKALQAAGEYDCFVKGRWQTGLIGLAKGADKSLKTLAVKDLAKPSDAKDQLALADAWWELAQEMGTTEQTNTQARAGHWYTLALPKAEGVFVRKKIEVRLKAIATTPPLLLGDEMPAVKEPVPVPVVNKEPKLRLVKELNSRADDVYPWLSQDGLRIYWTREGIVGKPSSIFTATRPDTNSPFEKERLIGYGRMAVFTADELEVVLLPSGKKEPPVLHVARRSSKTGRLGDLHPIDELAKQPNVKSPWISADGLTLVLQARVRTGRSPTSFLITSRINRRAKWKAPTPLKIELGNMNVGDGMTWPFLSKDMKQLYFCKGGGKLNNLMVTHRDDGQSAFRTFTHLTIDGNQLNGRSPRYVEATNELFFSSTSLSNDFDLWVVDHFKP